MPLHSPSTFVVRAALAFEFVQYFNSTWCVIDTGFFEMLLEICRSWHKLKNETKKHFGFFLTAVPEFRTPCATACPGRIQRRGKEMVGVGRGCGRGAFGVAFDEDENFCENSLRWRAVGHGARGSSCLIKLFLERLMVRAPGTFDSPVATVIYTPLRAFSHPSYDVPKPSCPVFGDEGKRGISRTYYGHSQRAIHARLPSAHPVVVFFLIVLF